MTTLIFGGTGAIGSDVVRRLTARGETVAFTGRDQGEINALTKETGAQGHVCEAMAENAVEDVVYQVAENADNGLTGLVYTVGSIVIKSLKAASDEDFLEAYKLNTLGAARALKAATPALKKTQGSAVLFSTVACTQGFANHTVIAAAKGGVEGLTISAAAELAPEIRVNCIAPSLTSGKMARTLTENETMADSIAKMHPLPRLGQGQDCGAMAAFLLSHEAAWITGQILHVDGGRSSLRPRG